MSVYFILFFCFAIFFQLCEYYAVFADCCCRLSLLPLLFLTFCPHFFSIYFEPFVVSFYFCLDLLKYKKKTEKTEKNRSEKEMKKWQEWNIERRKLTQSIDLCGRSLIFRWNFDMPSRIGMITVFFLIVRARESVVYIWFGLGSILFFLPLCLSKYRWINVSSVLMESIWKSIVWFPSLFVVVIVQEELKNDKCIWFVAFGCLLHPRSTFSIDDIFFPCRSCCY